MLRYFDTIGAPHLKFLGPEPLHLHLHGVPRCLLFAGKMEDLHGFHMTNLGFNGMCNHFMPLSSPISVCNKPGNQELTINVGDLYL